MKIFWISLSSHCEERSNLVIKKECLLFSGSLHTSRWRKPTINLSSIHASSIFWYARTIGSPSIVGYFWSVCQYISASIRRSSVYSGAFSRLSPKISVTLRARISNSFFFEHVRKMFTSRYSYLLFLDILHSSLHFALHPLLCKLKSCSKFDIFTDKIVLS